MRLRHFEDVTLLITHYNRSESLTRLLTTIAQQGCSFGEIVVSDDSSSEYHIDRIRDLQRELNFTLLTSSRNRGLGHNMNKGQQAVSTPFTLYIQEDFFPAPGFADRLEEALSMLAERPDLDIIRFYAYLRYPYLKEYRNGYSEIKYVPWGADYRKIYCYSDHPHLRRDSFTRKFGTYAEGIAGDRTEYLMCLSFIQNNGKGLFYNDYQGLFQQKNSSAEPSTMDRRSWRNSNNLLIGMLRDLYRQVKYNWDLHFVKGKQK